MDQIYIEPDVDIYETEESVFLLADLPGVKKEDLKVTLLKDIVTLEALISEDFLDLEEQCILREWEHTGYRFSCVLARSIDPNGIKASIKDGVLTLQLNKTVEEKPHAIHVEIG